MNVAALVHFAVPYRRAGSETMLHALLTGLSHRGHAVTVFATDMPEAPRDYIHGGIRVCCLPQHAAGAYAAQARPDVLISHHHRIREAARVSVNEGIPLVVLAHNDFPESLKAIQAAHPAVVVVNSEWMAVEHGHLFARVEVVRPPVFASEHATTPGDRVTLVNLNDDKGGRILADLAVRMPDVGFTGVIGGHGIQHIPNDRPGNLDIVSSTSDMRSVWAETGILIMPSAYESYGMAGVEAMHSGIPVIAAPTPGLRESLGDAGVFVDRENRMGWVDAIRTVMADWTYYSERARTRARELDPQPELQRWAEIIESL